MDSHTTRPTFGSPEASVITTQGCCGRSSDAERKVGVAAIHTYVHTDRHTYIHAYIHTRIHTYTSEMVAELDRSTTGFCCRAIEGEGQTLREDAEILEDL